ELRIAQATPIFRKIRLGHREQLQVSQYLQNLLRRRYGGRHGSLDIVVDRMDFPRFERHDAAVHGDAHSDIVSALEATLDALPRLQLHDIHRVSQRRSDEDCDHHDHRILHWMWLPPIRARVHSDAPPRAPRSTGRRTPATAPAFIGVATSSGYINTTSERM